MVVVQIIVELEWHTVGISLNFLKRSVYVAVSNENLEKIFSSHFSADRSIELCYFVTQFEINRTRYVLVTCASDLVHT
jgi:hypothetical protein